MKGPVLLDTGPLVAFLDRREPLHAWACEQFAAIHAPMLTCEAVLSEAAWLLRRSPGGKEAVIGLIEAGVIALPFRLADEHLAVGRLLAKYRDVPMSLADACLVRMTEIFGTSFVVTIDADFSVYRKHGRLVVPIRTPPRT